MEYSTKTQVKNVTIATMMTMTVVMVSVVCHISVAVLLSHRRASIYSFSYGLIQVYAIWQNLSISTIDIKCTGTGEMPLR